MFSGFREIDYITLFLGFLSILLAVVVIRTSGRRVVRDRTHRQLAERALAESEEKYRKLFNHANDVVLLIALSEDGRPGRLIDVNDAACLKLGYNRDELIGQETTKLTDEFFRRQLPEFLQHLEENGHALMEKSIIAKDGRKFWFETNSHLFLLNGKRVVLAIARDTSERKTAEEFLMLSRYEAIGVGVIVFSPDGKISHKNNEVCSMMNVAQEHFENKYENSKKSRLFFHEVGSPVLPDEFPSAITLKTGRPVKDKVIQIYRAEKGLSRWYLANSRAVRLPGSSEIKEVVVTIEDITGFIRTKKELTLANKRLRNTNKELAKVNQYKSEFLASISHELRTPLTAVMALTGELLLERLGSLNEKQREYLESVRNSGSRLIELIDDLLDLSRIERDKMALHLTETNIGEITREVVKTLGSLARSKEIDIIERIEDSLTVIADTRMVMQVVSNLLGNSIKFTPTKGRIEISVQNRGQEGTDLIICDNGPGIPEEEQALIFEAFYRGERGGIKNIWGTGLGLTLVKKIADLHNGTVNIHSVEGDGTTFSVFWPANPV